MTENTIDLAELETAIETIERAAAQLQRDNQHSPWDDVLNGVTCWMDPQLSLARMNVALRFLKGVHADSLDFSSKAAMNLTDARSLLIDACDLIADRIDPDRQARRSRAPEMRCACGWDPDDRIRDHGGPGTPGEFLDTKGEPDYHGSLDRAIAVVEDFADWQEGRPNDEMLAVYRDGLGRDLRQMAGRLAANRRCAGVVENKSA